MFYFIEDPVVVVFMRPEKVVVSHPESQVIAGTVDVVKAVCYSVRSFISTVEPLYTISRTIYSFHGRLFLIIPVKIYYINRKPVQHSRTKKEESLF